MMSVAQKGDTVRIHYTGRLSDDRQFDSSAGRDPLEFTVGEGRIIPGVEQAIIGMKVGEEKTVTIPSAEAYGPHRPEMVAQISRDQLPPDLQPEVGQQLQMNQEGQTFNVTIAEVSPESVTLDANHPLAGQDLTFELELLQVV